MSCRRQSFMVSPKWEFPPSIRISPSSSSGINCSINVSTGLPAFTITYCPGGLLQREIEGVHYSYADLQPMMEKYDPAVLADGFNTMGDGEKIFYISNPALGLWADRSRFGLE